MANELTILTMAKALASHSGRRQSLISENMANADTRGFAARDLKPFAEVYSGPTDTSGPAGAHRNQTAHSAGAIGFAPAASRPGHVGYSATEDGIAGAEAAPIAKLGAESPDGNSVSVEDQMARGVSAMLNHEMALNVFRKSMDLLRMSVGRSR